MTVALYLPYFYFFVSHLHWSIFGTEAKYQNVFVFLFKHAYVSLSTSTVKAISLSVCFLHSQ